MRDILDFIKQHNLHVEFEWIPRGQNIEADGMGREAFEAKQDIVRWED